MTIVAINEKTKEGKSLINFLSALSEKNDFVKILSDDERVSYEDSFLADRMDVISDSATLSYNEGKKEFDRIKKGLSK